MATWPCAGFPGSNTACHRHLLLLARRRARTKATAAPGVPAGVPEQALHACLVLLYPHLLPGSRRALRMACKATLLAMDSCVSGLQLRQPKVTIIPPPSWPPGFNNARCAKKIRPPSKPNDQERLLGACASRWPAAGHLVLANLDLNAGSLTFPPSLKALTLTRTYPRSKGPNVVGPLASLAATLQVRKTERKDCALIWLGTAIAQPNKAQVKEGEPAPSPHLLPLHPLPPHLCRLTFPHCPFAPDRCPLT